MVEKIKQIKNIFYKRFDFVIFIIMVVLLGVGFYTVRQAGLFDVKLKGLFTKQLLGIAMGLVIIVVMQFIDYRIICRFSFILYIGVLGLLMATLLFGDDVRGVKRWMTIARIQIQPSELAKIALIIFLAFLCNSYKDKLQKFYVFIILAVVAAIPTLLIIIEPHLSSSLAMLVIFGVIIYSSGISYKVIGTVLAVAVPVIAAILISVTVFNVSLPFIQGYQINRILSHFTTDKSEDETGKYQQNQALVAIEAGGLSGKTISEDSSYRNYSGIYAKESDFIFSIVGEEFGFIGSAVIVLLYLILNIRCLIIAAHAPDYMGKLICIGVSALLTFQVFVNVGVATDLLPNTGLPLPFISNGLTSLVSSMIAIGLVLNIGLRRKN